MIISKAIAPLQVSEKASDQTPSIANWFTAECLKEIEGDLLVISTIGDYEEQLLCLRMSRQAYLKKALQTAAKSLDPSVKLLLRGLITELDNRKWF